ncbi:uncharacterized protein RB166_002177 [Leptodactylus fuscus]|uniref:uncharacterized protein LOC142196149 n=1 Tax=Leptodactylus fuscus TaxID=238119 RepID=UPI003F4EA611
MACTGNTEDLMEQKAHSAVCTKKTNEGSGQQAHEEEDNEVQQDRVILVHLRLLILLTALSLSSGADYVRRGSDITDCSMKCPNVNGILMLYKICRGHETNMVGLWCDTMWHNNISDPRFHLNTSSGCWTLTDAGKNDSCVYNTVYHNSPGTLTHSKDITVIDPVLISNITSNSSWLGQDIAVSVQFSGEEAAVTWEVDGGPVPDRYRLIDDNRTMIIPSARIDDAGRKLHVHITNPVSEETREYQLEITAPHRSLVPFLVALLVILLGLSVGIFLVSRFWVILL